MINLRAVLWATSALIVSAVFLQACGAPAPRELMSITIAPMSGDAKGSPVQFVATGTYTTQPYTVTPLTANWGVQTSTQVTATITQNGLATCKSGTGATVVEAWVELNIPAPAQCNVVDPLGNPDCTEMWGTALLTCP
ncbi:MAG: hypothetical protein WBP85_01150 [Terracidiphilus sp.]